MAPAQPITFVVPGTVLPGSSRGSGVDLLPEMPGLGARKAAVRLGVRRSGEAPLRLQATAGDDVVVLHIANGPSLVLHPESARDLFLAQGSLRRDGTRDATRAGPAGGDPSSVVVPAQLRWQGLEDAAVATRGSSRGFLGDVLLRAVEVFTGPLQERAHEIVAARLAQRVDGQVDEAVYALRADGLGALKGRTPLATLPVGPQGAPTLVLVHGTFSDTAGTFGKLWGEHPSLVRRLFEHYEGRIAALDHATLARSPIDNALTLLRACAPGARLHLLTHSRGGLVAEVLARVCHERALGPEAGRAFADPVYQDQRAALAELAQLARSKDVRVERIVRVACPARGTLLASRRLDAYVSVLKWGLDLVGAPVLPTLVEFIGGVAQCRLDPSQLPGLATMVPDSALVRWLHDLPEPIDGELRVLAGDLQGDSLGSWLKTLLTDAFFWTDHDLVVQTRSMYGGAARQRGAQFVLDQGAHSTHFGYFGNPASATAIVDGLVMDDAPGYRTIGPLSAAGQSSSGVRAARPTVSSQPDRPAVFVLPGILGSHLAVDGRRIWLGWRLINGLHKLEYPGPAGRQVRPDGAVGSIYDDLIEYLEAKGHEVIEFSYDWRLPMPEEARRLGDAVQSAVLARKATGQPVRLLAHSMGGLLARTMQFAHADAWAAFIGQPTPRLLMLGTPNAGSWAPMQTLSGDDDFSNLLVAFGAPFQDQQARQLMAQLPGFLSLQAGLLDGERQLHLQSTWEQLAAQDLKAVRETNWWHRDERQVAVYAWGVPPQRVLDEARALREQLDHQVREALPDFARHLVLVIGHADFTPDGYVSGPQGLEYLDAVDAGDGRVTRASAMLPDVPTWHLRCPHGSLPDRAGAFAAYLELLTDGHTDKLDAVMVREAGARRGAGTEAAAQDATVRHVRSRPSRVLGDARPPERDDLRAALRQAAPPALAGSALQLQLFNGDLRFVRQPLMLGHYRSLELTGTEWVVDQLVGGTLVQSLRMGQYPDRPGTHQLFGNNLAPRDNPLQSPRPQAVIVVGLGAEGKLRAPDLVDTVQRGTIAWAQRLLEQAEGAPAQFEIAATLMGSGGTGISAGQAAQLIAQGVWLANRQLADQGWPQVATLTLVELYLDRAMEAWRALQVQAAASPGQYRLADAIRPGQGALRRPLGAGYRGVRHDLIIATTERAHTGEPVIQYTLDTQRARTEVRAQSAQRSLLQQLVRQGATDANRDAQIGRTLFQLLVPVEMEPFLGGTTAMVLELDDGTAGIPWEMLDTRTGSATGGEPVPWAIRTKLLRRLRTDSFRAQVDDAGLEASVLVIGEPAVDARRYSRLPGARHEARSVFDRLGGPRGLSADRVLALISPEEPATGPDATTVINTLMSRDWRIVHIAGHGEPPELLGEPPTRPGDPLQRIGNPRGVVLSDNSFLGLSEIQAMRRVPELVFVNCCHLAATESGRLLAGQALHDPSGFAASVAQALIGIGVRCVIAAGWAVDDGPACRFAEAFYDRLLEGAPFIDAVAAAREAAWREGGHTWAAYQCYGDPAWTFRDGRRDKAQRRSATALADRYVGLASPVALALALETLVTECRYQQLDKGAALERLRYLERQHGPRWGAIGAVAEAFALAFETASEHATAIDWYRRALAANDGSASLRAAEQLGNLLVRHAWDTVAEHWRDAGTAQDSTPDSQAALRKAVAAAWPALDEATGILHKLADLQPTSERRSLLGSAYKRRAMLAKAEGKDDLWRDALRRMTGQYLDAEQLAADAATSDLFYPALNRLAGELVSDALEPGWPGFDAARIALIRDSLDRRNADEPDFWSVVGRAELGLYEALAACRLAAERSRIESVWDDLARRMSSATYWASVRDQVDFVLPAHLQRVQDAGLTPQLSAAQRRAEDRAVRALQKQVRRMARP